MDTAKRITILDKESLEITNKKGRITVVDGPCVVTVVQDKIFTLRKVIHYSNTYKIVQYTNGNDIHIRGPDNISGLPSFISNIPTNCFSLAIGESSHGVRATTNGLIVEYDISAIYMKSINDRLVTVSASSRSGKTLTDENTSPTQLISALDASSLKCTSSDRTESKACPGGKSSQQLPMLTSSSLEIKSLAKAQQAFSEAFQKINHRSLAEEKHSIHSTERKSDPAPEPNITSKNVTWSAWDLPVSLYNDLSSRFFESPSSLTADIMNDQSTSSSESETGHISNVKNSSNEIRKTSISDNQLASSKHVIAPWTYYSKNKLLHHGKRRSEDESLPQWVPTSKSHEIIHVPRVGVDASSASEELHMVKKSKSHEPLQIPVLKSPSPNVTDILPPL